MDINDRWREEDNKLIATIETVDFEGAALLLQQVAGLAEEHNHHPDIKLHDYNKVTISLTSHDAGKVTERDYKLASAIDQLL